jgi:hypothetical protein
MPAEAYEIEMNRLGFLYAENKEALRTDARFRLAPENGEAGAGYHVAAQEGLPLRDIAEAIGCSLGVRVEGLSAPDASRHFGWLAPLIGADNLVSSQATQERLS